MYSFTIFAFPVLGRAFRGWKGVRASCTPGIVPLPPQPALDVLEGLAGAEAAQVGVLACQWPRFLQQFAPGREPPLLRELARRVAQSQPVVAAARAALAQELASLPPQRRYGHLYAYLHDLVMPREPLAS